MFAAVVYFILFLDWLAMLAAHIVVRWFSPLLLLLGVVLGVIQVALGLQLMLGGIEGLIAQGVSIIAFDLVRLATGDIEGQRVAFGIRAEVDFGREPTARAAERLLVLIPPFTPRMLVRPHDRGIDGMLLVGRRPETRQGFECRVPHAELAPAGEPHED